MVPCGRNGLTFSHLTTYIYIYIYVCVCHAVSPLNSQMATKVEAGRGGFNSGIKGLMISGHEL